MKLWSLFSGGKDSIALAHYLSQKDELAGVVLIDTRIRAPEQVDYVSDIAKKYSWPLIVQETNENYDDLVAKYGFGRPWNHSLFITYLKGRAMSKLPKDFIYASGVRKDESVRRFGQAKTESKWERRTIRAPLLNWTTEQIWGYVRKENLPLSPCAEALHISGDCFCGAFADVTERPLMASFYPETMKRLKQLEKQHGGYWGIKNCKLRRYPNDSPLCFDCGASGL